MPKARIKKYQHGFTLVELAITLLIMGLVASLTTWGYTLLSTAQLRSIISEVEEYRSAVKQFEERYDGLPGDLYNAASLWGTATNGNHDRQISTWNTEGLQAWFQLQQAGLVKGNYTGATIGGGTVPGDNVALSKFGGAGFSFYYIAPSDANWDHGDTPGDTTITIKNNSVGNVLIFGRPATNSYTSVAVLSQEEALSIDEKVDDGWPDSGSVQSAVGTACTDTIAGRLDYDIPNNANQSCALAFKIEVD